MEDMMAGIMVVTKTEFNTIIFRLICNGRIQDTIEADKIIIASEDEFLDRLGEILSSTDSSASSSSEQK